MIGCIYHQKVEVTYKLLYKNGWSKLSRVELTIFGGMLQFTYAKSKIGSRLDLLNLLDFLNPLYWCFYSYSA